MATLLPEAFMDAAMAAPAALPRPRQLAALGTVLSLYRPHHGGELSGWAQASQARVRAGVDSDGLRESLLFLDARGCCCWRLYLLPDSDFLAWDRLLAMLPAADETESGGGVGERLWRRLAGRLLGEAWRASALRLHALADGTLAASPAPLSALGATTARAIARAEGADAEALADDCCCARSAALAVAAAKEYGAVDGQVLALPPSKREQR